ncbi:MAG: NUDIX hydrolase [Actinomycetota bacterium]
MTDNSPWFVEPIQKALAAAKPASVENRKGARAAAVLLMLYESSGEPWIVFTKRSEFVASHKGEISFPGGMEEPSDGSLVDTALRETHEEMGIPESDVTLIGELGELHTFVTGFIIKPYVALVPARDVYDFSEAEIAEVIKAPLAYLAEVGREAEWTSRGYRFTTNVFEVDGNVIWGATGRILREFLDIAAPVLGYQWPRPRADQT